MLKTKAQRFPLNKTGLNAFEFAGFQWPRYVAELPKGSMVKRLQAAKSSACGPYYHAPKPAGKGHGRGFYLESQGAPSLRWEWCDNVAQSIRHTGWFTDEDGIGDTIRGLVFRLPKGRGFLAGWSMGESMASEVDCQLYKTEEEAAYAADSLAETVAEKERDYQENYDLDD